MNANIEPLQFDLGVNQIQESFLIAQKKRVFEYLSDKIATATMVSNTLGIPQKNITRYKRDLEEEGKLREVFKTTCPITRHLACYITTDKTKFPISKQLNLFDND